MDSTLQSIFAKGFGNYVHGKTLPPHFYKAANQIIKCRTAALGGHIGQCVEGHIDGVWYNSCKHRFCPQCNEIQKERWLEKQKARLLDTPHHHIIFTLPHELEGLWLRNTSVMMNLLFHAVRDTLMRLLDSEPERRFLDALPGFLCAFHSWGRSLPWHPHLHCLITDGGLSRSGHWRQPKGSCFIPVRIVRDVFKGKYLAALKAALAHGELRLPDAHTLQQINNLCNKLGRVKWNVRICERYDHAHGVATYMARYIRGGALKNTQLLKVTEETVTFCYTPHKDKAGKRYDKMTLPISKFIQRYLVHVPEPGVQTVRGYGLYSNAKLAHLNQARNELGQTAVKYPEFLDWGSYMIKINPDWSPPVCKVCGELITYHTSVPRATGPPFAHRVSQGSVLSPGT